MKRTEIIPFRLLHMECCHVMLCWVNPRFPNFCPECGQRCFPHVRGWVTHLDPRAILKVEDIKAGSLEAILRRPVNGG